MSRSISSLIELLSRSAGEAPEPLAKAPYSATEIREKEYTQLVDAVRHRASVERIVAIGEATKWADNDAVDFKGRSAVYEAAKRKMEAVVLELLARGASPTGGLRWPNGFNLLHAYSMLHDALMLESVLKVLANRDGGRKMIDDLMKAKDRQRRTPMSVCGCAHAKSKATLCCEESKKMYRNTALMATLSVLLMFGADPNERLVGDSTALMLAAKSGNVGAIRFLIARGADIGCQLNDGSTELHLAAVNMRADCARELLKAGAHPDRPIDSDLGETPRQIAKRLKAAGVIAVFERFAPDPEPPTDMAKEDKEETETSDMG